MCCRSLHFGAAILIALWGAVQSNNINIDDTCSIAGACHQCLSRNSDQILRCQQLYFFITYSTGNSATRNNEREISRYCNGECPIILATADHYCGASPRLDTLLSMCPSYSEMPSGSLRIKDEGSACLSGSGECQQCIGDNNREAIRCLQLYLLATNQNSSSAYASQYCERNCPLVFNAFNNFCAPPIRDSFSYCQQSGDKYCGALRYKSESLYNDAVRSCQFNCMSNECTLAINEFGCCLRRDVGDSCPNIPSDCNLPIDASTRDLSVPDTCSVSRCSSCLSRDNRELQRCEQTYSYLVAAEGIQATQSASVRQRFCSGNCPILLSTSDSYCGVSGRNSILWQMCPSYNRIPSASVKIRASFGNSSQSCSIASSNVCAECILSKSPQPTRCLQLSILAGHPNMSNFYYKEFCKGNCPLTLATSLWYCDNDETGVQNLFQACRRNEQEQYCNILSDDDGFQDAVRACQSNCNSEACISGVQQYGCCLNGRFSSESCPQSQTSPCDIVTATAAPPNVMASSLLFAIVCLIHFIANSLY